MGRLKFLGDVHIVQVQNVSLMYTRRVFSGWVLAHLKKFFRSLLLKMLTIDKFPCWCFLVSLYYHIYLKIKKTAYVVY